MKVQAALEVEVKFKEQANSGKSDIEGEHARQEGRDRAAQGLGRQANATKGGGVGDEQRQVRHRR